VEGPDAKGDVCWCPIARTEPADFSGIEHALETRLHPDVISFYGSFYSDPLPMRAPDGGLTLLQLGQRRAGSPLSLFVAVTDEEDLNLCVHNELGIVLLERPSEPPLRQVAPSLAAFLGGLVPVVQVGGVGLLERSDRATP
jgi:SecY interacting protein Syd